MSDRDPQMLAEIDEAAARMVHDLFDHSVEHTVGNLRTALAEGLYDAVAGFAERLSQPHGCDHLDGPYRSLLARVEHIRLWARTTDQGTAAAQVQELLDAPTDQPGSDNPFAAVMEHALALAADRHRAGKSGGSDA